MSLTADSIETILQFLEPHLETLQTGFPTSTRPNEPALTKSQKRQKIGETLARDPGIFLTKWGSVVLYPRPKSSDPVPKESHVNGDGSIVAASHNLTAKDILDLFAPLADDYEVKFQLTKLYQQLQQLSEHASFVASRHHPDRSSAADSMDVDRQDTIQPEDRKPSPGQNDLFTRSVLSENTRRNRRLNYLLRHLAPPDPSDVSLGLKGKGPAGHATSHSSAGDSRNRASSSGQGLQNSQHHPPLASILSISGSMSNLSFEESTYFSDAEMESRAPELYYQYIGRFMDNDDDDDGDAYDDGDDDMNEVGDSSVTVESDDSDQSGADGGTGAEDADDEREVDKRRRRHKPQPKPFGKDVGLVDRILWNIDHPTRKQQIMERQNRAMQSGHKMSSEESGPSRSQQQHPRRVSVPGPVAASASSSMPMGTSQKAEQVESEFEEEFDTESEKDDAEMSEKTSDDEDDRKGPLKDIIRDDDEIRAKISVTPHIPPDPIPGIVSSTLASAAMTLEQPEERALFAAVENGGDLDSDEDKELDSITAERKEDQEALREEFVLLMKQRFLDGLDRNFDYSVVDFDENLDDLDQVNHDEEDKWFDEEGDSGGELERDVRGRIGEGSSAALRSGGRDGRNMRAGSALSSQMTFDERLKAWENSAQNGSGDYDY
ncbi:coiled-coil domain-containing protein-domain-containing protein [Gamsiella multidivaricata]|uniref:coiled-coil domain-containing protein-domain-containing protein n=1 Tax=Gamsiella multidivaricata TaxID=101098 RepID=UPI002220DE1E|nr:coiled-coil domain-containing protein-domain-containing protein [Gamsiella multidivaricata]KAG0356557.1 hypothetical protein BGZ54_000692 [Gamsiella multidivaricata]KAI7819411.1 coiled-coil domain-containing protein-domain-containing protein [Gamsiella multidivaricata]